MSEANTISDVDAGMPATQGPIDGPGSDDMNVVPTGNTAMSPNLDMVMDIAVTLSIELGRTRMSIHDLLQLKPDSVIEMQRLVDEPMDVLVNGTLVAHGEVVVIDERLGIRLTDIASPMERIKKLR